MCAGPRPTRERALRGNRNAWWRLLFFCLGISAAAGQAARAEQPPDAHEPAAVVSMTNSLEFEPASVTIRAGQSIKWVNDSFTVPHTVTCAPGKAKKPEDVHLPDGAEPFDSGSVQPGEVFTQTFTVPGRYKYFCIPHELAGMIGEVQVQPAEPSSQTGLADETQANVSQAKDSQVKSAADNPDVEHDETSETSFVFGAHVAPRPPDYRDATGVMKFLYWLGNFHPAATDLPVGILLAGFFSEILRMATRKEVFAQITRYCVWVGGLAALVTAFLGWCFAGFEFYDNAWMLTTHRILGSVVGIWGLVLIALTEAARVKNSAAWTWTFRGALAIAAVLIVATGYFGGAMIYGLDHYAWPNGPGN